ncbi:MAG: NmrA family NAD(P)-binding protein [Nitrososphaeraceae archaeon]
MTTTKNNETTILVTGASGTVGSEVVKQLTSPSSLSSDSRIRAAIRSKNKADKLRDENKIVEIVNMDYDKQETIVDAINGVDKLFLLTLPTPNMTEIASSLIKEAKKNDVKHIVKLSVLDADAEPGILIGRWHRQEEKIIEESGIPYTFLRSGAFMQNFINYFGQTIKTQNAIYIPAGDGKVSFVDVRDIADIATEILSAKNNGTKSK